MIEEEIVTRVSDDLKILIIGVWIVVEAAVAAETIDMVIDATTVVMAIVVDMAEAVMMIDVVVALMTVVVVMMIVVVDMTIDVADMMIDAVVVDSTGTAVMVAVEIGMIEMAMVAVASAAADAVSVLLMMTVHGGEMNLKFQLEEILEKKDQNDQNSTYYQEASRLMKIQIPHQPKRDQIHSGQLDQLTQVQKKKKSNKS